MKRLWLGLLFALALAASYALAQVPPTGSGVVGWLNAIYNQLSDVSSSSSGPRTSLTGIAAGTTASVNGILVSSGGKTAFICGFTITANATAATFGSASINNILGGNITFQQPVAAAPAVAVYQQAFSPCIPANAQAQNISVSTAAAGTAGVTDVYVWGYLR